MILNQDIPILRKSFSAETLAIGLLFVLYAVGIVGISTTIHPHFILLTPVNLLVSLAVMLKFHTGWDRSTTQFLIFAYLLGFGAELYGVQSGRLFGDYAYGAVLGPKLWGTPLVIGVNWMLLAYSIGVTINYLLPNRHWLLKGIVGALLMVGLDVLIEPVAIKYDFWSWQNGTPPLQNYLGWFLVSLPILCIFTKMHGKVRNKVAVALFVLQILFFLALNIL